MTTNPNNGGATPCGNDCSSASNIDAEGYVWCALRGQPARVDADCATYSPPHSADTKPAGGAVADNARDDNKQDR